MLTYPTSHTCVVWDHLRYSPRQSSHSQLNPRQPSLGNPSQPEFIAPRQELKPSQGCATFSILPAGQASTTGQYQSQWVTDCTVSNCWDSSSLNGRPICLSFLHLYVPDGLTPFLLPPLVALFQDGRGPGRVSLLTQQQLQQAGPVCLSQLTQQQ